MANYITPQLVDVNAFKLATTMNSYKRFGPKFKPRGDRLVAIDTALEALRDNYLPLANAAQTRGFLLLVIREARNWLRNVQRKADSGKVGTGDRHHKKLAIQKLVAEATDALIACTPGFAEAMQAYAEQKRGATQEFLMKGLDGVYRHEGSVYRSGGKSQGKTTSATQLHGNIIADFAYEPNRGADSRNRHVHNTKQKLKKLGHDGDVRHLIESMIRGEALFETFTEDQFRTFGRYVDARTDLAKVVYFSKMERLQHLKHIRDGKLYNIDDTPFATPHQGSSWAMDCYGNLFAGDRSISDVQVNHSSYLAGKDAACAGIIDTTADGTVTAIDNSSGHYKPTRENLHEVLTYLADQGLNFERATVMVVGPNDDSKKYSARDWIGNIGAPEIGNWVRNIGAPQLGNRQFTLAANR
jgi:hypothetical protein